MSKKTEVIYRRPKGSYNDNDPSSWEDNAIIDAYNASVNISTEDASSPLKPAEQPSSDLSHEEPIWQRPPDIEYTHYADKTNGVGKIKWKVGDKCVARYYEDELYYDAKILSIDEKNNSCEVEFMGYGNKEHISLDDIHHESKWENNLTKEFKRLSVSSSSSTDDSSSTESKNKTSSSSDSTSTSTSFEKSPSSSTKKTKQYRFKPRKNGFKFMPPPPMMGFYPGMPSQQPSFNQFMPMSNMNSFNQNFNSPLDNDDLSSLLMAWYMAGYQTGYFQGKHKKS